MEKVNNNNQQRFTISQPRFSIDNITKKLIYSLQNVFNEHFKMLEYVVESNVNSEPRGRAVMRL